MAGLEIPQQVLLGGGLFLLGFFIFIALYIISRLIAEKKGHEHGDLKKERTELKGDKGA